MAILTISDRCSKGVAVDTSGPALAAMAECRLSAHVVATACVPDEANLIAYQLRRWAMEKPMPNLILTTGGTGLGPRDITPEATAGILEKRHPQLLELARLRCSSITPKAYLSRGEAGTLAGTLIINLPGSERGATEFLIAMLDVLPHAISMMKGLNEGHDRR